MTSAWRHGGSGPAGPGRRIRCRRSPALEIHAKPGEVVRAGAPLLTLHTDTPERFPLALQALEGGWSVAPEGTFVERLPLVIDRIA